MDFNFIKKLVQLVDASNVTDLEIEEENTKIKISKKGITLPADVQAYAPSAVITQGNAVNTLAAQESGNNAEETETDSNLHEIKSPIVGTFFRASSPDAASFVQVGDSVSTGTTLCIIEAMKLMNEIESDVSGRIEKILVENGKPVEYNQPLFLIKVD